MSLHLRYRLWIAEMNADINVLRIFDDYVAELSLKKEEPEIQNGINHFKQEFTTLREEIDQLRHEMHLIKMHLAAQAKQPDAVYKDETDHAALQKRYNVFRKNFDSIKNEFGVFEGEWLG